jgi:hypothetical protein
MYPFGYASVYKVTYLFPSDDRWVKCIGNFLCNSKLRLVGQMFWLWHCYCAPFLQSHEPERDHSKKRRGDSRAEARVRLDGVFFTQE